MYLICIEMPNWSERFLFKNKNNAIKFIPSLIADIEGMDIPDDEMEGYVQAVLSGDYQPMWLEQIDVQDA